MLKCWEREIEVDGLFAMLGLWEVVVVVVMMGG